MKSRSDPVSGFVIFASLERFERYLEGLKLRYDTTLGQYCVVSRTREKS